MQQKLSKPLAIIILLALLLLILVGAGILLFNKNQEKFDSNNPIGQIFQKNKPSATLTPSLPPYHISGKLKSYINPSLNINFEYPAEYTVKSLVMSEKNKNLAIILVSGDKQLTFESLQIYDTAQTDTYQGNGPTTGTVLDGNTWLLFETKNENASAIYPNYRYQNVLNGRYIIVSSVNENRYPLMEIITSLSTPKK